MAIALLMNPASVGDVCVLGDEGLRGRVSGITRMVDRAKALAPDLVLYVHMQLWAMEVGTGLTFRAWASRNARHPKLRDGLESLLRVCSQGPYLDALRVDADRQAMHVEPSIASVPELTRETVVHGLRAMLADDDLQALMLSVGAHALETLPEPRYHATRGTQRVELPNLRSESDVETSLAATEFGSRDEVLEAVRRHSPRVRFLPECERLLRRAHIDVPLTKLFRALCGLDACAEARLAGEDDHRGAYTRRTGIECSGESSTKRSKPSLRRQFLFKLPGETERRFFGDHAKVGESTRIHFFVLDSAEGRPDASGVERDVTIWVGRIDKHPK